MKIKIVQPDGNLVSIDWPGEAPDLDDIAKVMRGLFPEGKISIENAVCIWVCNTLRRKTHIVNISSTVKDILDKYLGMERLEDSVSWNGNFIKDTATLSDLGITQSDNIDNPSGHLTATVKMINISPV